MSIKKSVISKQLAPALPINQMATRMSVAHAVAASQSDSPFLTEELLDCAQQCSLEERLGAEISDDSDNVELSESSQSLFAEDGVVNGMIQLAGLVINSGKNESVTHKYADTPQIFHSVENSLLAMSQHLDKTMISEAVIEPLIGNVNTEVDVESLNTEKHSLILGELKIHTHLLK